MSIKKSFNIATKINPETGLVFGDKYGEPVLIRRPTATDKLAVATRHAGQLSSYGARPFDIPDGISSLAYIFCLLDVICETRPDWTKQDQVFDEDEPAIFALYEEVSLWLDTFRPRRTQPKSV
jgi:hypothetical protein